MEEKESIFNNAVFSIDSVTVCSVADRLWRTVLWRTVLWRTVCGGPFCGGPSVADNDASFGRIYGTRPHGGDRLARTLNMTHVRVRSRFG